MSHGVEIVHGLHVRLSHGVFDHLDARIQALAHSDVATEVPQVLDVVLGDGHLGDELVHVRAMTLAIIERLGRHTAWESWRAHAYRTWEYRRATNAVLHVAHALSRLVQLVRGVRRDPVDLRGVRVDRLLLQVDLALELAVGLGDRPNVIREVGLHLVHVVEGPLDVRRELLEALLQGLHAHAGHELLDLANLLRGPGRHQLVRGEAGVDEIGSVLLNSVELLMMRTPLPSAVGLLHVHVVDALDLGLQVLQLVLHEPAELLQV